jgi:hypothetical protein
MLISDEDSQFFAAAFFGLEAVFFGLLVVFFGLAAAAFFGLVAAAFFGLAAAAFFGLAAAAVFGLASLAFFGLFADFLAVFAFFSPAGFFAFFGLTAFGFFALAGDFLADSPRRKLPDAPVPFDCFREPFFTPARSDIFKCWLITFSSWPTL